LLEEIRAVIRKRRSREDLTRKNEAGNLSATAFGADEAVFVGSANRKLLFDLVCVDISRKSLSRIDTGGRGLKPSQYSLSFVVAALADEMPGRFWGKEKDGEEDGGLELLDSEGDTVCPFGGHVHETSEDACGNELPDNEAHVGVGGEIDAERQR
jgi:hypothetical protein